MLVIQQSQEMLNCAESMKTPYASVALLIPLDARSRENLCVRPA